MDAVVQLSARLEPDRCPFQKHRGWKPQHSVAGCRGGDARRLGTSDALRLLTSAAGLKGAPPALLKES